MRLKKTWPKVTLSILGLIFALVLFEIFLRTTEKQKYDYTPCTSLDKDFQHVMIPNKICRFKTEEWDVTYRINSLGLRDKEVNVAKKDQLRILILGDSFTQGFGVEEAESFPNLLEEKLNTRKDNRRYEVVNTGVFAYSPLVEHLYLVKRGLELKPDLVMQVFTITDFWDDRQRFNELVASYPNLTNDEIARKIKLGQAEFDYQKINVAAAAERTDQTPTKSETVFKIKTWLRQNIKIYKLAADFVKGRNKKVQQDVIFMGNIDKDLMAITRGDKISEENWLRLWEIPMMNIEFMKNLLEEKNIPFVVVAIPDATQVSDEEWPNRKALGFEKHHFDPRGPYQNELSRRLEKLGVPFIDLLADFKGSGISSLYFKKDSHWTVAGHKLASEIIYKQLFEKGIIKNSLL